MTASLLPALKRHFGFDSFRPHQEDIIRDSLAGRDVFALLPTGGGKSLCFQLPALVRGGLTVVVSPLIALMKDQADALRAAGIAATVLNSSLDHQESSGRLRGLRGGEYRLLYVAPERLMLPSFLAELGRWNVSLIAVDEAHCISEWGHDFRPEYRQLAALRDYLPRVPVMALTATATGRVRADIVQHLRLNEPNQYVASFNRPNLTYRVIAKDRPYQQVLDFVRQRQGESGIVYCLSRRGAESLAARLMEDGVKARPYHAGLSKEERSLHQDLFLRDEVRVMCATIAFGMGVNKPNVRYVLHHDLPKNIESYYQETGRAGRDGLPSECVLLFSASDTVKLSWFIDETPDRQQQEVAREQLQQMVQYAESSVCRRKTLLHYFGEEFEAADCESCDNCLSPRSTFDGTTAARKLLGSVYFIRKSSGFGVGLNYVVEVLAGADTERIRRWRHNELPVYGKGKEHSRSEWAAMGRELVRLGLLRQAGGKFSVLELTSEGQAVLAERKQVTLTQPVVAAEGKTGRAGAIACDEALFERLRAFRKKLADERDVPAYVVFSDVALRQMARDYPSSELEFSRISGVGQAKLREFAAAFLAEIAAHLRDNPRLSFEDNPPPAPSRPRPGDTHHETLMRFRQGLPVEQIAAARGLAVGTIYGHLAGVADAGERIDLERLLAPGDQREIAAAFARLGSANLTGVKEFLGDKFSYGLLRLYRSVRQQGAQADAGGALLAGATTASRSGSRSNVAGSVPMSSPSTSTGTGAAAVT